MAYHEERKYIFRGNGGRYGFQNDIKTLLSRRVGQCWLLDGIINRLLNLILSLQCPRNFNSNYIKFKGTVSPDITFYFRFCKVKSVLSVRLLRVFNFFYFVVL